MLLYIIVFLTNSRRFLCQRATTDANNFKLSNLTIPYQCCPFLVRGNEKSEGGKEDDERAVNKNM